jgi:hypothetical protein
MKLKQSSANKGLEAAVVTIPEIEAAIESLTTPQSIKLREFARMKVAKLGRSAEGYTWKDLLNEAFTAVIGGNRAWDKSKVDFFGLLVGAISSIASNKRAKFDRTEKSLGLGVDGKLLEVPIDGVATDDDFPPQLVSPSLNPERELLVKEQEEIDKKRVEAIMNMSENRDLAAYIILELMEGKIGPEVQQALNITQTQYETEMRWIRRNARKTLSI